MAPRCRDMYTLAYNKNIFWFKSVIFYLFVSRFYAMTIIILEKVAA